MNLLYTFKSKSWKKKEDMTSVFSSFRPLLFGCYRTSQSCAGSPDKIPKLGTKRGIANTIRFKSMPASRDSQNCRIDATSFINVTCLDFIPGKTVVHSEDFHPRIEHAVLLFPLWTHQDTTIQFNVWICCQTIPPKPKCPMFKNSKGW